MSADFEAQLAELRKENAAWRTRTHAAETAYSVYVNRYPLGDLENFSVTRWAYARAQADAYGTSRLAKVAPYEAAFYEKAQGDYVSGIDGGFLAPEAWSTQWVELLRNFTVLDKLPVMRLSVPWRVVHIPKITNDVTIAYPAENAAPTATAFKFGQLTYTARKSMALMNVSNELIRDSAGVADAIFRQSTAMAIAQDRDNQLLMGLGGGNPTGIVQSAINGTINLYYPNSTATSDVGTSPAHATPSFFQVSSLRNKVDTLNGSANVTAGQARCTGMIAHTRFLKSIHVQTAAAGAWTDAQGRPFWPGGLNATGSNTMPGKATAGVGGATGYENDAGGNSLLGIPWALTNILPTNSAQGGGTTSSFMVAGMWERYALFECLTPAYDATILSGTSTVGFQADETQIRMVYRYDGQPVQPEAFAVMAGCDQ